MAELRSILFVSPLAEKHLGKAPSSGADAIQLDLEDAVLMEDKDAARSRLGVAIAGLRQAGVEHVIVRVNAPWLLAFPDIEAACAAGADCITLPKVETPDRVAVVAQMLDEIEARDGAGRRMRILVLVESARGLEHLGAILKASDRISAVTLGPEDFAGDMGSEPTVAANEWANIAVLAAARSAGVTPFGFPGSIALIDDLAAFRRQAERARELGFRGAAIIHPAQVAILNDVFSASSEEIRQARRIVEAAEGRGAFVLDGKMIDAPIVQRARNLLARQERDPRKRSC